MFPFINIRKRSINMNGQMDFYKNNYILFGEYTAHRIGLTKKEERTIRKEMRAEGQYMLPIRKMTENKMPKKKSEGNEIISSVQLAVSSLDLEDQTAIIELAKNMPEPSELIDESLAIQYHRVRMGLQSEAEQGRLLDTTETAIGNLVNMIQAKKNISEGQEINLNVNNTITSLLDELEDEDDVIEMNIDEINKKEQLKDLRLNEIEDLLNE